MNPDSIHEAQESVANLQAALDDAQRMLQAAERAQEAAQRAHERAEPHATTLRTASFVALGVIVVTMLTSLVRRQR